MERNGRTFDVLGQLGSLRRYARSLVRNSDEAEDLVHDALVKAYEARASFRPGASLRSWLMSVLHNVHVDRLRQSRSLQRRHAEASADLEPALPAGQDDVVRLGQIRAAFSRLPEDQREALHLVAIEGLSYQEAASVLGIPAGTLMSRLSRARAQLRNFEDGTRSPSHLRLVGRNGHDDD